MPEPSTPTAGPVPGVVAHRGLAAHYPENTLAAVRGAIEAGASDIEIDVQVSADGVAVLHHDKTLQRTAGRPETIAELDAATLTRISVGEPDRFGAKFATEKIPTLAECAALLAGHRNVRLFVELKPVSITAIGREAFLDAVLPALAPVAAHCVIISFDPEILVEARARGAAAIGWVLPTFDAAAQSRATALSPDWLFVDVRRVPAGTALWTGPWRWVVYEVVSAELALYLAARGAHYVESMQADTLAGALAQRLSTAS